MFIKFIKFNIMFTSSAQKTLAVSALVIVLIAILLRKPKAPKDTEAEVEAPVGISKLLKRAKKAARPLRRKPVSQLKPTEYDAIGSKNKNVPREETAGCDESAPLDSPEYKKCTALVGSGRTIVPGDPTKSANNINTEFVKENFQGEEEKVGNPFGKKSLKQTFSDESFLGSALLKPKTEESEDSVLGETLISKSTLPISKDAKKALPFAKKGSERDGGLKKAPFRSTLTLGEAAVSPVGMSQEEVEQSARRLDDVNIVQQTTGGQLNLLVHRA